MAQRRAATHLRDSTAELDDLFRPINDSEMPCIRVQIAVHDLVPREERWCAKLKVTQLHHFSRCICAQTLVTGGDTRAVGLHKRQWSVYKGYLIIIVWNPTHS